MSKSKGGETQLILDKLAQTENNMKQYMHQQLTAVNETIKNLRDELSRTQEAAEASQKRADDNLELINNLTTKVNGLEETVATQSVQIKVLQTRLEDQTCRNSRNSLIIRGVEEEPDEKWEDTRRIVCEKMSENLDIGADELSRMIERIHRGKPPKNEGPRVVHARFFNWNHIELVKDQWWKNGKGTGIFIDQRYGPDTTYRRNKALAVRKQMKDNGEIVGGYVKYPAKLFVKYQESDRKYHLQEDYSSIPVPLPRQSSTPQNTS